MFWDERSVKPSRLMSRGKLSHPGRVRGCQEVPLSLCSGCCVGILGSFITWRPVAALRGMGSTKVHSCTSGEKKKGSGSRRRFVQRDPCLCDLVCIFRRQSETVDLTQFAVVITCCLVTAIGVNKGGRMWGRSESYKMFVKIKRDGGRRISNPVSMTNRSADHIQRFLPGWRTGTNTSSVVRWHSTGRVSAQLLVNCPWARRFTSTCYWL